MADNSAHSSDGLHNEKLRLQINPSSGFVRNGNPHRTRMTLLTRPELHRSPSTQEAEEEDGASTTITLDAAVNAEHADAESTGIVGKAREKENSLSAAIDEVVPIVIKTLSSQRTSPDAKPLSSNQTILFSSSTLMMIPNNNFARRSRSATDPTRGSSGSEQQDGVELSNAVALWRPYDFGHLDDSPLPEEEKQKYESVELACGGKNEQESDASIRSSDAEVNDLDTVAERSCDGVIHANPFDSISANQEDIREVEIQNENQTAVCLNSLRTTAPVEKYEDQAVKTGSSTEAVQLVCSQEEGERAKSKSTNNDTTTTTASASRPVDITVPHSNSVLLPKEFPSAQDSARPIDKPAETPIVSELSEPYNVLSATLATIQRRTEPKDSGRFLSHSVTQKCTPISHELEYPTVVEQAPRDTTNAFPSRRVLPSSLLVSTHSEADRKESSHLGGTIRAAISTHAAASTMIVPAIKPNITSSKRLTRDLHHVIARPNLSLGARRDMGGADAPTNSSFLESKKPSLWIGKDEDEEKNDEMSKRVETNGTTFIRENHPYPQNTTYVEKRGNDTMKKTSNTVSQDPKKLITLLAPSFTRRNLLKSTSTKSIANPTNRVYTEKDPASDEEACDEDHADEEEDDELQLFDSEGEVEGEKEMDRHRDPAVVRQCTGAARVLFSMYPKRCVMDSGHKSSATTKLLRTSGWGVLKKGVNERTNRRYRPRREPAWRWCTKPHVNTIYLMMGSSVRKELENEHTVLSPSEEKRIHQRKRFREESTPNNYDSKLFVHHRSPFSRDTPLLAHHFFQCVHRLTQSPEKPSFPQCGLAQTNDKEGVMGQNFNEYNVRLTNMLYYYWSMRKGPETLGE